MPPSSGYFSRPSLVFPSSVALRIILLIYGRWQDSHSAVKYTDVDYLVFTDAARFTARGLSPYDRATYRYTPLLAWLLLPTAWGGLWFEFGKVLFATGDVVTGWMMWKILREGGMGVQRATKYASLWLLNPMVANISTRGSSEGIVAVVIIAALWATLRGQRRLAAGLLGLGVHLKIYPFIYAASILMWIGPELREALQKEKMIDRFGAFLTKERIRLATDSIAVFMTLGGVMYYLYGMEFVNHSYTYHLIRTDHRHNFSIYNTLLHLNSAYGGANGLRVESLAFLPQLLLSVIFMPLYMAKTDLASTMLAQTLAFVTFNKVCTSQYFLWYMVFLPFYLPRSSLVRRPALGMGALVLWILGQAVWLQQAYELEFLGSPTFFPGLWLASILFFTFNCGILGIVVDDIVSSERTDDVADQELKKTR